MLATRHLGFARRAVSLHRPCFFSSRTIFPAAACAGVERKGPAGVVVIPLDCQWTARHSATATAKVANLNQSKAFRGL